MKITKLLFLPFLFGCIVCNAQMKKDRIEIVLPTIQQEATSIWRTINDIAFFEKQGYQINLPEDTLIDT
ncbi:MAG: hypothetical protein AAGH81_19270, partial [Bacteroidota bacterium]